MNRFRYETNGQSQTRDELVELISSEIRGFSGPTAHCYLNAVEHRLVESAHDSIGWVWAKDKYNTVVRMG